MTSKLENCDKAANNRNKNMIEPPDGGVFAWMIVGAFGIANVSINRTKSGYFIHC